MRDLKPSNKNVLRIVDPMSASTIELYYRTPTTSERVAFETAAFTRENGSVVDRSNEAKIEAALNILTGFSAGSFGYDGRPISADPADPGYREDWKALLAETAGDILSLVGSFLFLNIRVARGGDADDPLGLS